MQGKTKKKMHEKNKRERRAERNKMKEYLKYTNIQKDVTGIKRLEFIIRFVSKFKKANIIDIGCGTGSITIPIGSLGYDITGIDVDKKSIEIAKKRNVFEKVKFFTKKIQEVKEKYDIALSTQVLEHLENPLEMMKEISRITRKYAVITVPNGYGPSEITGRLIAKIRKTGPKSRTRTNNGMFTANYDNPHIQKFRIKNIKEMAEKAGFKVIIIKHHNFILGTFPFNQLFFHTPFKRWLEKADSKIADILPGRMTSGWYFVMKKWQ